MIFPSQLTDRGIFGVFLSFILILIVVMKKKKKKY